jgi:hypothetical protein
MQHETVLYLKFDPVQPSSYVWVPLMYDATPFDRGTDAKSIKRRVPDASTVVVGEDSYYYVMKVRESTQT